MSRKHAREGTATANWEAKLRKAARDYTKAKSHLQAAPEAYLGREPFERRLSNARLRLLQVAALSEAQESDEGRGFQ